MDEIPVDRAGRPMFDAEGNKLSIEEREEAALGKAFFDEQVAKYGDHSRAQGFSYPVSQQTQFNSATSHVTAHEDRPTFSLLDLAGGNGDFGEWLSMAMLPDEMKYSCVDNQPVLLDKALERARESTYMTPYMFSGDLFDPDMPPHDWVVCLGLYAMWNDDQASLIEHIAKLLQYMTVRATTGICINFISPWADYHEEYHRPISPVVPISILKELGWEQISVDLMQAPHLYMINALKGEYEFRKEWGTVKWDTE